MNQFVSKIKISLPSTLCGNTGVTIKSSSISSKYQALTFENVQNHENQPIRGRDTSKMSELQQKDEECLATHKGKGILL